jgi:hypothetical protein
MSETKHDPKREEGKLQKIKKILTSALHTSGAKGLQYRQKEERCWSSLTLLELCFPGLVILVGLYCLYRYLKEQAELPKYKPTPGISQTENNMSENRA